MQCPEFLPAMMVHTYIHDAMSTRIKCDSIPLELQYHQPHRVWACVNEMCCHNATLHGNKCRAPLTNLSFVFHTYVLLRVIPQPVEGSSSVRDITFETTEYSSINKTHNKSRPGEWLLLLAAAFVLRRFHEKHRR